MKDALKRLALAAIDSLRALVDAGLAWLRGWLATPAGRRLALAFLAEVVNELAASGSARVTLRLLITAALTTGGLHASRQGPEPSAEEPK